MSDTKVTVEIDQDADAAYIRVGAAEVADTVEFSDSLVVDLDRFGMVVGIEVLGLGTELDFSGLFAEHHVRAEVVATIDSLRPSIERRWLVTSTPDSAASSVKHTLLQRV